MANAEILYGIKLDLDHDEETLQKVVGFLDNVVSEKDYETFSAYQVARDDYYLEHWGLHCLAVKITTDGYWPTGVCLGHYWGETCYAFNLILPKPTDDEPLLKLKAALEEAGITGWEGPALYLGVDS